MLISLALDHHRADVQTRERFHLTEERVTQLYQAPRDALLPELALVSTCNRIELYGWSKAQEPREVVAALSLMAERWMGDDGRAAELIATATHRAGEEAARHLLRVAAGLESQVLGDAQILGQVRAAYRAADAAGTLGPGLHRLFDTAMHTGKRVSHETALVGGRNSVGAEGAALALQRLGSLRNRRCVVIGCGKTGARAARQLVRLGAVDLVLVNRTAQKSQALAAELWGRAAPFANLHRELANADVAIVATGGDLPSVRAASLRFCREMAGTAARELLLIDLGMPRCVEAECAGLSGVMVADLDRLQPPIAAAEEQRRDAVPQAQRIVEEELAHFMEWVRTAEARAAIRPLHDVLGELCRREVAFAAGDEVAERAAERIVAKLLSRPMIVLRQAAERGEPLEPYTAALQELFQPTGEAPAPSRPAEAP
ncbi:MAG: glutamyl-tRNA reductase [Gemmatimonadales bacterium]|nr:glutamyl-tRNA reductase [Gemmatimonadales bacterium]